jgi:hypothetical protein
VERSRTAARRSKEAPLSLEASLPLRSLLEEVRAPGANRSDVDALLRGLAGPLARGESARERADVLLVLIQDAELGDLSGSNARPVRTAALEALLALGYPYALEVPPELLAKLRPRTRRPEPPSQWKLHLGLALPILAAVVECSFISAMDSPGSFIRIPNIWFITPSLVTSVLPMLLALLGRWKRSRVLNGLGIWPMGLVGLGVMLFTLSVNDSTTPIVFCLGAARLIGAVCLRLPRDAHS